jgi:hypothetical protein
MPESRANYFDNCKALCSQTDESGFSMKKRLEDKAAIVVGAGTEGEDIGNGKATAIQFAREGAKVLCVDLNESAAEVTATMIKN